MEVLAFFLVYDKGVFKILTSIMKPPFEESLQPTTNIWSGCLTKS